MPDSSETKHRGNCQSPKGFAPELHSPETNPNLKSHNITSRSISNSHNLNYSATYCYFLSPDVEQMERLEGSSERPFLELTSKQLEAIQSQIDPQVLETETECKIIFSDSNEMSRRHQPLAIQSAPPAFHRPRQEMNTGHSSQSYRARTSIYVVSTKKRSKRRTENSMKENDRLRMENFFGCLALLAFCSLLFFLIFLFLLCVLFLFYLYAFHSRYR